MSRGSGGSFLFHKRHPSAMGVEEINAYLTYLAVEGHVSASTQNQALSAILFLYKKVLEEDIGSPSRSKGDSGSTWQGCGCSRRKTGEIVSRESGCQTHLRGSTRMRDASGHGSGCFLPGSCRSIRGAEYGEGITCTRRVCSVRFERRRWRAA